VWTLLGIIAFVAWLFGVHIVVPVIGSLWSISFLIHKVLHPQEITNIYVPRTRCTIVNRPLPLLAQSFNDFRLKLF
jgi:hypothetical protein